MMAHLASPIKRPRHSGDELLRGGTNAMRLTTFFMLKRRETHDDSSIRTEDSVNPRSASDVVPRETKTTALCCGWFVGLRQQIPS